MGSIALALLILGANGEAPTQRTPAAHHPRLDEYLAKFVKLTVAERQALAAGGPVTKLLDADPTKEVAVFGAIWVNAPIDRYVDAVRDIETFERGGAFRITRRISTPPSIDDFAALRLPDEDVDDLRTCRVGDCEVKLSAQTLQRVRMEVNWKARDSRPAIERLMREIALEYVSGYLEGGNERLAVYRDKSRPTFVASEFRSMIDEMPELTTYMPDVRRYLLDYPAATLPAFTSFLYWQEAVFGLKPTIRISHLAIREGPDETVVMSKMLYASHYFWTGLELRVLRPEPARGNGFWFVTVNRSRSDGLGGFTGRIIRGRVRNEVRKGTLAALQSTKRKLEGK